MDVVSDADVCSLSGQQASIPWNICACQSTPLLHATQGSCQCVVIFFTEISTQASARSCKL